MGKGAPHKYRKRSTPSKASKSQKNRREREKILLNKKTVENDERKNKSYTARLKLSVIKRAEEIGNRAAGREFEIDERCIRRWREEKPIIEKMPGNKRARRGGISKSKEGNLNNDEALESKCDLPVISAVHGKEYFEKHPFPVQPIEENGVHFDTNSIVIKTEPNEEENVPDKMDESVSKTIPETVPQTHLKDINIPYNQINNSDCNLLPQNTSNSSSYDKENKLLFDVIKYLDECANVDKFDLAGKLYAAKLRTVPFTNQQAMAENLCRQVLVEAEHFNLDEKIVLLKEQPLDHLANCRTPTHVTNKSDLEPSFYLELEKDSLFQIIEKRLSINTKEDRFDKFGNFYATKMRSFSSFQYYCADKLINEIVLTAELGRLRASYKLTKTGASSPQTFASGKSYAKEYRTKICVLPVSDQTCASNKTQSNKQLSSSSPGNPSPQTSAPRKSYAKRCRTKVSVLPASGRLCATNTTQPDKQVTYSSIDPSSDPDDPPPQTFALGKSYAKKCETKGSVLSVSDETCASSKTQSNKQFTYSSTEPYADPDDPPPQTFAPGKTYAKKFRTKVSFLPVSDGACASSKTLSTPNVISIQNNEHKCLESSPSGCNEVFKVSVQEKTSQSINEKLINNSDQALKNSLVKPPVFPLTSIPGAISIQNNEQQKSARNLIKVVFLKQGQQAEKCHTLPLLPDEAGQL